MMKILPGTLFKKLLVVALVMMCSMMWGQSIFTNPIDGTNPNTANPFTAGQVVNPNITVTGIGRGPGNNGSNASNRYNSNSWNTPTLDLTAYFEFTITPNPGYQINFTSFVYTGQKSNTGPVEYAFRSSADSYTANIGSPTTDGTTISLSGAAYQGVTNSITFRFYAWGTDSANGTFSINDFTFNGTVTPAATGIQPPVTTAATIISQTGFNANWQAVTGATGYYLDISTSPDFSTFVTGYNNLDVGNTTSYGVSGLAVGTSYYYRVRAYNIGSTSANSNVTQADVPPFTATATLVSNNLNFGPVCLNTAADNLVGSFSFTVNNNVDLAIANITGPNGAPLNGFFFGGNPANTTTFDEGNFYIEDIEAGELNTVYVVFNPQAGVNYNNVTFEISIEFPLIDPTINTIEPIVIQSEIVGLPTADAQSFCSDATVAGLQVTSGTNVNWYSAQTGGTALAPDTALTSGTYYVTQTIGDCESLRVPVAVNVNVTLDAPVVAAQQFCGTATAASLPTGTDWVWYTDAAATQVLDAAAALATATYYVRIESGDCQSAVVPVSVTVNPLPDAPAIPAQEFCAGATVADFIISGNDNTATPVTEDFDNQTTGFISAGDYTYPSGSWTAAGTGNAGLITTVTGTTGHQYVITGSSSVTLPAYSNLASITFDAFNINTPGSIAVTKIVNGSESSLGTIAVATGSNGSSFVQYTITVNDPADDIRIKLQNQGTQFLYIDNVTFNFNPQPLDINIYEAITGGTALTDNTALQTATYYVSQVTGGCESLRTPVSVTVNPAVAAPVVAAQVFCGAATAAELPAGGGLLWYSLSAGGTPLAADTALQNGTYYVSQTSNNCESPLTPVTVTINPQPVAPTAVAQEFCEGATAAQLVAQGTVVVENLLTDNFNNLSNWNAISLQGSKVWGISSAGNPPTAPYVVMNGYQENNEDWLVSDPIAIPADAVGATLSFLNAYNYSGPDLEFYYTANYTGDVNTTQWTTLSPALSNGGFNFVNSGILDVSGAVGSDLVIGFRYTSTTTSAKAWEIDNLVVNAQYEYLNWYDADNNLLTDTDVLTTGTYYVTQTINGCESQPTAVAVTVNVVTPPTVEAQVFCGSAMASELPLANGLTWYTDEAATQALTADTALVNATTYYVTQTGGACESQATPVLVTINPIPDAPVMEAQLFCGSAVASELSWDNSMMWYTDAAGTQPLATDAALATATYYVTVTVDGCESETTAVEVTVNPVPEAPEVEAPLFCGSAVASELSWDNGLMWYTDAEGTAALATDTALTTGTYYVTVTVNGCESATAAVEVTVNPVPEAPEVEAQLFCGATVASELSWENGYMWYTDAEGTNMLATDAALATGTYYVSQTVNGCESATTAVEVTVNPVPAAPVIAVDAQTFCNAATVANIQGEGELVWYTAATGGTALEETAALEEGVYVLYAAQVVGGCESTARTAVAIELNITDAPAAAAQLFCGSAMAGDIEVTGVNVNIYDAATGGNALATDAEIITGTYYVTQTIDGCESPRTAVEVTVNPVPAAPVVEAQQFCGSAIATDLPILPGYIWYTAATGENYLPVDAQLITGTYYVSQMGMGCESDRTAVSVTVNPTPEAPMMEAQLFCGSAMADELPWDNGYIWYTDAEGTTALATDAALATGTYYVSQTVNGCESATTAVAVTVNPTPEAPVAEAQSFCGAAIASDLSWDNGYMWYTDAEGTTALATDAALATGTYYVSQTVNGCESATTAVAVTINPTPDAPMMEAQVFCGAAIASDLSWDNGYMWYTDAEGTTALATDAALATGTYYVSQTVNGCESATTAVTVTITTVATPTGEATQEYEAGQTLADLDVTGQGIVWYADAEMTQMLEATTALEDGTTYYAVSVNGDCTSEALAVTVSETSSATKFDKAQLTYYPNPVSDVLNISYKGGIDSVEIYNLLGQQVLLQNVNSREAAINMSALAQGSYVVKIVSGNTAATVKVLKK